MSSYFFFEGFVSNEGYFAPKLSICHCVVWGYCSGVEVMLFARDLMEG